MQWYDKMIEKELHHLDARRYPRAERKFAFIKEWCTVGQFQIPRSRWMTMQHTRITQQLEHIEISLIYNQTSSLDYFVALVAQEMSELETKIAISILSN